jgi:hypothetical protein
MYSLGVTTPEEFMTVAYIHNASYLGGMLGMTVALVWLAGRRRKRLAAPVASKVNDTGGDPEGWGR